MGEVYAIVGEKIKSNYASIYEKTKRNVRMNFNDMDFEHAKERDALEDIIKKMEQICDTYAEAAKDIGMS